MSSCYSSPTKEDEKTQLFFRRILTNLLSCIRNRGFQDTMLIEFTKANELRVKNETLSPYTLEQCSG